MTVAGLEAGLVTSLRSIRTIQVVGFAYRNSISLRINYRIKAKGQYRVTMTVTGLETAARDRARDIAPVN